MPGLVTDFVIYGTGGMAREVRQIATDINNVSTRYALLGFLEDDSGVIERRADNLNILGGIEWLVANPLAQVVLAIGSSHARQRLALLIQERCSNDFATLIHPQASVGDRVQVGEGSIICQAAVLTTDIEIGKHVIVNVGATLAHDDVLEDFVTLAPGVRLAGATRIGQGCDVGIGACTIPGVSIGSWSIVGAGAVVTHSLPPNVTAVGVPAVPIKKRSQGWHEAPDE